MATNPSKFKASCMPYEIYYNAFTEAYHLIKYLGMTADGRACCVRRLGIYKTKAEGMKAYNTQVKKGA